MIGHSGSFTTLASIKMSFMESRTSMKMPPHESVEDAPRKY